MTAKLSKLDQEFVMKAAQDNAAEIAMAKLAQKKLKSGKLRKLADTMLKDHTELSGKLSKLADQLGVKLPKEPSTAHRSKLDELEACDGDEFEQRFMEIVTEEHEGDVKLFRSESEHGGNEELKRLAAEVAPVLHRHLEMARSLH